MSNDARSEQLLDICASMVDQDGFAAVSFDRIAGDAEVSRTVLYQQFGDLNGMFEALVERSTLRAKRALDEAATCHTLWSTRCRRTALTSPITPSTP
ncbi:MAG: TetR/AcrR family transcriptional regulator [Acidimicrobiia bacterium]|nr:TetR/AcrR family transcriptional regulator [Acidimicrobiia bacterium]